MSGLSVSPLAKFCKRCSRDLPLTSFSRNRSATDGLQFYCRSCGADIYRERQAAKGRTVRERVTVPPGFKHCRDCDETKSLAEWHTNRASRDGYAAYCIPCTAKRGRESYFRRKYGLSQEELSDRLAQQKGVCCICLNRAAVHVDHDHVTGTVRGVLCFTCNAALGQFQDDPEIIRRAADYLEGNVWQPIQVAPGVSQLPSSRLAALALPSSSANTRPNSFLADARHRQPL
jgi:hypothetical protein